MRITSRYLCVLAVFALMLTACAADPVGDLDDGTADADTDADSDIADDDDDDTDGDDADTGNDDDAGAEDDGDADSGGADGDRSITVASAQADEMDPTTYATAAASAIMETFCWSLYVYDYDAELQPQLAADLPEFSEDGLTVTIPLREDALFNDGTELDAESVIISLERHLEHEESNRAGEIEVITGMEAVDEHTVELTLEEPFAPLTAQLSGPPGRIMSPAQLDEMGDDFADDPVCAGPFSFVDRPDQDVVIVEKSEHFWDADSVEIEEITYQVIDDNAVAVNNLLAGEIDVAAVSPTNLGEVEGNDEFQVINSPGVGYQGLTINLGRVGEDNEIGDVDTPLAQEPLLREALELAIDKEAINEIVYDGLHTPACSVISPEVPFWDAVPECPERDVERAEELIAEAGFDAPVEISLLTSTDPDVQRVAELIQSMAGEAGFEVSVDAMESTTAIDTAGEGDFDTWLIGFGSGPDPDAPLHRYHHSEGTTNYGIGVGPTDDEIDELLDATRAETEEADRVELLREPLELIAERRSIIYLYHPSHNLGARSDLTGLDLKPNGNPEYDQVGFSG